MGQGDRGDQRGSCPQLHPAQDQEEQYGFERHQEDQSKGHAEHRKVRHFSQTDGEEETDQKQIFKAQHRLGQFVRFGPTGKHHTKNQRPQIRLEPNRFEKLGSSQGKNTGEQHQQLTMAAEIK